MKLGPQRLADARAMGAEVEEVDGAVRAVFPALREEVAVGWALRHRAEVVAPQSVVAEVEAGRERLVQAHAGEPSVAPLEAPSRDSRQRLAGLSDQRLARLLTLPAWLESRPQVTVDEAAAAFACRPEELTAELELLDRVELPGFGNVFERDIDADGHIRFQTVLEPRTAELSADEIVALLSVVDAAAALLPGEEEQIRAVEGKLRGALPPDARGIHLTELERPVVGALREAIADGRNLAIEYRGRRDDEFRTRRVTPIQLQFIGGAVYLAAHDLDIDEPRTFRVDRISEVADVDADPATIEEVPVPDYVPGDEEVTVELLLEPTATWILALAPPTAAVELEGGAVHALVRTDVPDWLLAHVRAAGGAAEVLRPPRLRDTLVDSVGAHAAESP